VAAARAARPRTDQYIAGKQRKRRGRGQGSVCLAVVWSVYILLFLVVVMVWEEKRLGACVAKNAHRVPGDRFMSSSLLIVSGIIPRAVHQRWRGVLSHFRLIIPCLAIIAVNTEHLEWYLKPLAPRDAASNEERCFPRVNNIPRVLPRTKTERERSQE
jgi:hypothetical protein